VTPGFQVKDSQGDKFLIKFNPPGFPDLANQVAVIGSRLLWAAGYNVTDEAVSCFDSRIWTSQPTRPHRQWTKRPFTRAYLEQCDTSRSSRDGATCLASRFLEGKPLGPYSIVGAGGMIPRI
jgi:hypothetical protein